MDRSALRAISPVDGRYRNVTETLADYFSEEALIRYRIRVEVAYFIELCRLPLPQLEGIPADSLEALQRWASGVGDKEAQEVKDIERVTNHDVKAVEYRVKEAFDTLGLSAHKEFVHFALTSQDINNTAVPLSLKDAWEQALFPVLQEVLDGIRNQSAEWDEVPMLARTHGQPASPTRLGKEWAVFLDRLEQQIRLLNGIPFAAKFGGATGNFNAHHAAYPDVDWAGFADHLVNGVLGLSRSRVTTQIEPYDHLAAFCDGLKRINTIFIDFARDVWTYISMDYFKQEIRSGEVGSSVMPHKVNPIDFENAEGNLGVANALLEHLSAKLPVSRLQRDLTDSTVLRNLGVPLAHTLIALRSMLRGIRKLILNEPAIRADLERNWAVVAEAVQTILRREGYPNPYEALKSLTRTHGVVDRDALWAYFDSLEVDETVKKELRRLTPLNYTGI